MSVHVLVPNYLRVITDKSTNSHRLEFYNSNTGNWETVLEIDPANKVVKVFPALTDNAKLEFGSDRDFSLYYDSTKDRLIVLDNRTNTELFSLKIGTSVGYTVPVSPADCVNVTGLPADSTGVKFTSKVRVKVDARYLSKIRLRASWTASHSDSVTEVRLVGTQSGIIAKVSGNSGTDVEAETTTFVDGELLYIEVAVTTASGTSGATTDLVYAVIEFVYEMT